MTSVVYILIFFSLINIEIGSPASKFYLAETEDKQHYLIETGTKHWENGDNGGKEDFKYKYADLDWLTTTTTTTTTPKPAVVHMFRKRNMRF
jgi:hypothetical protein